MQSFSNNASFSKQGRPGWSQGFVCKYLIVYQSKGNSKQRIETIQIQGSWYFAKCSSAWSYLRE